MTNRWRIGGLPVAVVPALVCLVQLVGSTGAGRHMRYQALDLDAAAYALLAAGPVALLFRRRFPVATLTAVMALTGGYMLRGYVLGPVFLSLVVAIVAAMTSGHRAATWIITVGGVGALSGLALLTPAGPFRLHGWSITHLLAGLTWLLLVLAGAEFARIRSERAVEARRVRMEEERRRASEERLRIARELHDVLAHNISMINVQAGVALHLMDERPEQARTALSAIKEASKEALAEVRSVLGVLRQVDEGAPRSPVAGLARMHDLISRARAAGITVEARTSGTPYPLPAGVDLAAFRILQEALTNVTRHAGPGVTATVHVTYGDGEIALRIEDDGRGGARGDLPGGTSGDLPGGGDGIAGMRERVAALGGDLLAGPRPDRPGFRVLARLPVAGPGPEAKPATGTASGAPRDATMTDEEQR